MDFESLSEHEDTCWRALFAEDLDGTVMSGAQNTATAGGPSIQQVQGPLADQEMHQRLSTPATLISTQAVAGPDDKRLPSALRNTLEGADADAPNAAATAHAAYRDGDGGQHPNLPPGLELTGVRSLPLVYIQAPQGHQVHQPVRPDLPDPPAMLRSHGSEPLASAPDGPATSGGQQEQQWRDRAPGATSPKSGRMAYAMYSTSSLHEGSPLLPVPTPVQGEDEGPAAVLSPLGADSAGTCGMAASQPAAAAVLAGAGAAAALAATEGCMVLDAAATASAAPPAEEPQAAAAPCGPQAAQATQPNPAPHMPVCDAAAQAAPPSPCAARHGSAQAMAAQMGAFEGSLPSEDPRMSPERPEARLAATAAASDPLMGPTHLPEPNDETIGDNAAEPEAALADSDPPPGGAVAGDAAPVLPPPVTVQVASRSKRRSDSGGKGGKGGKITRGAVGLFHPELYLNGAECIECGTEMMSRGRFERLAGTATAKWHVSIKVLPSGMTLGKWLQQHGLPILQGRPRKRRAGTDEDETEDVDEDAGVGAPAHPPLKSPPAPEEAAPAPAHRSNSGPAAAPFAAAAAAGTGTGKGSVARCTQAAASSMNIDPCVRGSAGGSLRAAADKSSGIFSTGFPILNPDPDLAHARAPGQGGAAGSDAFLAVLENSCLFDDLVLRSNDELRSTNHSHEHPVSLLSASRGAALALPATSAPGGLLHPDLGSSGALSLGLTGGSSVEARPVVVRAVRLLSPGGGATGSPGSTGAFGGDGTAPGPGSGSEEVSGAVARALMAVVGSCGPFGAGPLSATAALGSHPHPQLRPSGLPADYSRPSHANPPGASGSADGWPCSTTSSSSLRTLASGGSSGFGSRFGSLSGTASLLTSGTGTEGGSASGTCSGSNPATAAGPSNWSSGWQREAPVKAVGGLRPVGGGRSLTSAVELFSEAQERRRGYRAAAAAATAGAGPGPGVGFPSESRGATQQAFLLAEESGQLAWAAQGSAAPPEGSGAWGSPAVGGATADGAALGSLGPAGGGSRRTAPELGAPWVLDQQDGVVASGDGSGWQETTRHFYRRRVLEGLMGDRGTGSGVAAAAGAPAVGAAANAGAAAAFQAVGLRPGPSSQMPPPSGGGDLSAALRFQQQEQRRLQQLLQQHQQELLHRHCHRQQARPALWQRQEFGGEGAPSPALSSAEALRERSLGGGVLVRPQSQPQQQQQQPQEQRQPHPFASMYQQRAEQQPALLQWQQQLSRHQQQQQQQQRLHSADVGGFLDIVPGLPEWQ